MCGLTFRLPWYRFDGAKIRAIPDMCKCFVFFLMQMYGQTGKKATNRGDPFEICRVGSFGRFAERLQGQCASFSSLPFSCHAFLFC